MQSSESFRFLPVTEYEFLNVMQSLKTDKRLGHDGISNVFIKNAASSITRPFALIFRRIGDSQYPDAWKAGNWTAILKDGEAANMENYRGVLQLLVST